MTQRILFIGDSITDCRRDLDPRGLGDGYVDIVADELAARGEDVVVLNRGVAGDRVAHLRQRWQRDVIDEHPDVLTVFVGVNDTLVTFYEGRPTRRGDFERDLDDVLRQAVDGGIGRIVVVDPFILAVPGDQFRWGEGTAFTREDLDLKRPVVAALAARYGATFVPLQEAMSAAAADRAAAAVASGCALASSAACCAMSLAWAGAFSKGNSLLWKHSWPILPMRSRTTTMISTTACAPA